MLLIACALSLLAIVAGMMLLAQTKRENLGNLFKYVSWFIVTMGFLCILCIASRCAMRCCHHGEKYGMSRERMMDGDDGYYQDRHMGGHGMMGYHRGMQGDCRMMGECCEGMENCREGMGSCHEGMGECNDGMNKCKEGMNECKEGMGESKDGGCPMMHGGMMEHKDTAKKN